MPKGKKDHPEVTDVENICNISPDTKLTKDVCDKVKKNKTKESKRPIK